MRITEMNENYEEFVSRDCTNTETWAANWVIVELLKQSNKVVNVSCDPVVLANECYWVGNNLEVGLMVADDDGSLYYLDSITFKEDDKANIYGYAYDYDYETYSEELNGETANDPENELMKIVRFDN